jgi:putrescine aminotransferase
LNILEEDGLVANSADRGEQLLSGLRKRLQGHPLVREVRGRGLFVGVEFGPTGSGILNRLCPALVETITRGLFGQWVALRLLERGVICALTYHQWNILRLEPPLTVQGAQVERVIDLVGEVLEEYRGVGSVVKDSTLRLMQQFLAGWKF